MKRHNSVSIVRRSVAVPSTLIEELQEVAPPEIRGNLNRLVIVSLQEHVARRREEEFERSLAEMSKDPQVQAECLAIAREFAVTDGDGLQQHD
jgi:hypothetical protein